LHDREYRRGTLYLVTRLQVCQPLSVIGVKLRVVRLNRMNGKGLRYFLVAQYLRDLSIA